MKSQGWRTGAKDVLEKLADPTMADSVNPSSYKFRLNIQLETGDERYQFVNTTMWVASGCRRGTEGRDIHQHNLDENVDPRLTTGTYEVIYDAYRVT